MIRYVKYIFWFIFLTALTQVGGIIYLISTLILSKIKIDDSTYIFYKLKRVSFHIAFYLLTILFIIPPVAAHFGRVPLPFFQNNHLVPRTIFTAIFNRRYVRPELREITLEISEKMGQVYPGITINYFDANFPFYLKSFLFKKGFPLLPHLSHSDGKKLDIGFIYNDIYTEELSDKTPSFIGYGISEESKLGEEDRPLLCSKFWMYSFMKNIYPQGAKKDFLCNQKITKELIGIFAKNNRISKIFLEPHLIHRFRLFNNKISQVQCGAVRHDDHFHVQIR